MDMPVIAIATMEDDVRADAGDELCEGPGSSRILSSELQSEQRDRPSRPGVVDQSGVQPCDQRAEKHLM